jgi:hypothetical protein
MVKTMIKLIIDSTNVHKKILKLQKILNERNLLTKIIGQVHDDVMLDIPKDELEEIRKILKKLPKLKFRKIKTAELNSYIETRKGKVPRILDWKEIKTRRHWPKAGTKVLVTREWKHYKTTISIAHCVLFRGKKHFAADPLPNNIADAFPFENVIAWMNLPQPFEKEAK